MQLTIAPAAVARFQKKAPKMVGTAISSPAEAAEASGAIISSSIPPGCPATHQAKPKAITAMMGITHWPTLSSPFSETLGLISPLWISRAQTEERVSSIESIVEIAAAVIPIMTTIASPVGIKARESNLGVARSAFSRPGTSRVAPKPHSTEIMV